MSRRPNNPYDDNYCSSPKAKKLRSNEMPTSHENTNSTCVNAKIFDDIKALFETRCNEIEKNIKAKNSEILEALAEQQTILEGLIQKEDSGPINFAFPLKTELELQLLNDKIGRDNREEYINTIASFLRNGISKHFTNILSTDIILSFNLDGTHGKKRLKDYHRFCDVLLGAIESLMPSCNAEDELRKTIQTMKNRHYKKVCLERKSYEIN